MTLDRGTLLNNRYRIIEILGQGGMASIYRAVDENLGVDVAVKENLFTTEEYARQFRLEAVILASLRHPNMPRVTDHFVIDGQGQYLVMDYIEGEDLRQRMDRLGPLPEDEVIVLGVAICEALSYLHSRNPAVLHRDVKPGNVKVTPQGQILLVDFGLAKVMQRGEATTTGARAMTPGYSPPEQYGTARTDARTDVYSLGATLYSALTDALPEDGLARAMGQADLTPVRQRNPKVSKRLAQVLEKALEVRPEHRFQTAEELKQGLLSSRSTTRRKEPVDLMVAPPPLDDFSESDEEDELAERLEAAAGRRVNLNPAGGSRPVPGERVLGGALVRGQQGRGGTRPWAWIILVVAVLLFTGGTATYLINPALAMESMNWVLPILRPTDTATPPPTITPAVPVIQTATATNIVAVEPTFTPTPSLTPTVIPTNHVEPTATVMPSPVPTPLGGGSGQIAFASDRLGKPNIWVVNLDGSGLTQLTNVGEGACQPSWAPDGNRLVFVSPCPSNQDVYRGSSLFIINADGSGLVPLPSVPGGDYDPAWSPDGMRIAFTSLRKSDTTQIFVIDLSTFEVTSLEDPNGRSIYSPTWSPNGAEIAFIGSNGQVYAMSADGTNRRLLSRNPGNIVNAAPTWSADGQTIVFTQWATGISGAPWLSKVNATEGSVIFNVARDAPMAEADFSPDGYWLVYHSWPDGRNHDLYIMTPGGVGRQQITNDSTNEFDPAWKPAN